MSCWRGRPSRVYFYVYASQQQQNSLFVIKLTLHFCLLLPYFVCQCICSATLVTTRQLNCCNSLLCSMRHTMFRAWTVQICGSSTLSYCSSLVFQTWCWCQSRRIGSNVPFINVHHVSSGYANFVEFDDLWTMSPWRHLSMLLWQLESTTATWYSSAHQGLSPTNYNECWTLPHVSSAARANMTVDCHRFYMPTCTGSMWQIGSSTGLALQSTGVSTTKCHIIW